LTRFLMMFIPVVEVYQRHRDPAKGPALPVVVQFAVTA
jgi:hypothetical protein